MSTIHERLVAWSQQAPGGVSAEAFDQLVRLLNEVTAVRDNEIAENLRLIGAQMGLMPAAVNIGIIQSGLIAAQPGEVERLAVQMQQQFDELRRQAEGGDADG